MKKFFLYFYLLSFFFFFSCFKSKAQKELDRKNALEFIQQADNYYFKSKYNESLNLYLKAIKLYKFILKDMPELYFKIGFSYDKGKHDYKKAKKYYLKAIENLKVKNNLPYLARAYFHLGYIAFIENDINKKEQYFNSSFTLYEKLLTLDKMEGEDYFRVGYYYYDKGNFPEARKYFNLAIKNFKKECSEHFYHAAAYYNIGITYWKEEDYVTTKWYWKQALRLDPDNELYKMWYDKVEEQLSSLKK